MNLSTRLSKLESVASSQAETGEPLTEEQIRALSDADLMRLIFIETKRPRPFQTAAQIREEKREIERLIALPDDEFMRLYREKMESAGIEDAPRRW